MAKLVFLVLALILVDAAKAGKKSDTKSRNAKSGFCQCIGTYNSVSNEMEVSTFSNEANSLLSEHEYLATSLIEGKDCDHEVSWRVDPNTELMREVIIRMVKSKKTLKFEFDLDDFDDLVARAVDITGGVDNELSLRGNNYKKFRNTKLKWRFREKDGQFEADINGCGLEVTYGPERVTLRELGNRGHDGGVCRACGKKKGKGGNTCKGFNIGSLGNDKLAKKWEKISCMKGKLDKSHKDRDLILEFCSSLEDEKCADDKVDIYGICLRARAHFNTKDANSLLQFALKKFREECARPVLVHPPVGDQRCVVSRTPTNQLYAVTFDNMKFDISKSASYLLSERKNSGACDHQVTAKIGNSRDDVVWIRQIEVKFSQSGSIYRIIPREDYSPFLLDIDSGDSANRIFYDKELQQLEGRDTTVKRDGSGTYLKMDFGSCDLILRTNGRRVYLYTSNGVEPANLQGACGNGDGVTNEPMPTNVYIDMYPHGKLRKDIYNLGWQQGPKMPLGSDGSRAHGKEICRMYEDKDGPLSNHLSKLDPGTQNHFVTTCKALVNEFYDKNKITMYRHVCNQFRSFRENFGEDELEEPAYCATCSCRVKGHALKRVKYYIFGNNEENHLDYDGGCSQLLTELKDPTDECYFRIEIDVRDRDGKIKENKGRGKSNGPKRKEFDRVRIVVGFRPVTIVLPRDNDRAHVTGDWNIKQLNKHFIRIRSEKCGVDVDYKDKARTVTIKLQPGYEDRTQGICGTCNGKEDDWVTSSGDDVSGLRREDASRAIIDSYQCGEWINVGGKYKLKTQAVLDGDYEADEESCSSREERFTHCSPRDEKLMYRGVYCGYLVDMRGPLGRCLKNGSKEIERLSRQLFRICQKEVCKSRFGRKGRACGVKRQLADACDMKSLGQAELCPNA